MRNSLIPDPPNVDTSNGDGTDGGSAGTSRASAGADAADRGSIQPIRETPRHRLKPRNPSRQLSLYPLCKTYGLILHHPLLYHDPVAVSARPNIPYPGPLPQTGGEEP
jgi:hypothetical protein